MKLKTYEVIQLNYVLHTWKNYIIQLFNLRF